MINGNKKSPRETILENGSDSPPVGVVRNPIILPDDATPAEQREARHRTMNTGLLAGRQKITKRILAVAAMALKDGVPATAKKLGIAESTVRNYRTILKRSPAAMRAMNNYIALEGDGDYTAKQLKIVIDNRLKHFYQSSKLDLANPNILEKVINHQKFMTDVVKAAGIASSTITDIENEEIRAGSNAGQFIKSERLETATAAEMFENKDDELDSMFDEFSEMAEFETMQEDLMRLVANGVEDDDEDSEFLVDEDENE